MGTKAKATGKPVATYDGPAKPKPPTKGAVAIRLGRQPKGAR